MTAVCKQAILLGMHFTANWTSVHSRWVHVKGLPCPRQCAPLPYEQHWQCRRMTTTTNIEKNDSANFEQCGQLCVPLAGSSLMLYVCAWLRLLSLPQPHLLTLVLEFAHKQSSDSLNSGQFGAFSMYLLKGYNNRCTNLGLTKKRLNRCTRFGFP